jgi:isoleucyl-tRNA synthetase
VAVDTNVTEELAKEGLTREIVHRLQTMRKTAGFEIADYIVTYYQSDDYMKDVMQSYGDYIRHETLSREIRCEASPGGAFIEEHMLGGHTIELGIIRQF